MKVPAILADLGLAASSPTRCATGRAGPSSVWRASLLHPAVIDVSAWWGQYESIYVLGGLAAALAAFRAVTAWPRPRSPSR